MSPLDVPDSTERVARLRSLRALARVFCGPGARELEPRITFTQRKFRGFETYTGPEARARGFDFVADLKAPIIDGTEER